MKYLNDKTVMQCDHIGLVKNDAKQDLVTISDGKLLVETEPQGWDVTTCTFSVPPLGIKPCKKTLAVSSGYSDLVTVQGRRVCTDQVKGFTDGSPPGTVLYTVRTPGQDLVTEAE